MSCDMISPRSQRSVALYACACDLYSSGEARLDAHFVFSVMVSLSCGAQVAQLFPLSGILKLYINNKTQAAFCRWIHICVIKSCVGVVDCDVNYIFSAKMNRLLLSLP